jgi:glycosyltransferase involved in cell wall biosynthesis
MEISVVICTHNPRDHFMARVLGALRAQTLPMDQWEMLLVDNLSADPLAGRFDLSWHPNGRHVLETELGLTPARLRGIAEGTGKAIVFVDDDNVLAPDYLEHSLRIAEARPYLGAWGGSIEVEYEVPPPDWVRGYRAHHAWRHFAEARWSNIKSDLDSQPYGAGMCLRKSVCDEYARRIANDPFRRSFDRKGTNLLAGGDIDLVLTADAFGLGWGNFPELIVTHLIPQVRTEEAYMLRLREEVTTSNAVVAALAGNPVAVDAPLRYRLRDLWWRLRFGTRPARFLAAERRGVIRGNKAAADYLAGNSRTTL